MKRKIIIPIILSAVLIILAVVIFATVGTQGYSVTTYSMGSYVNQTVYGGDEEGAAANAASAVAQLDDLISWRTEDSDVYNLNEQAGNVFIEIDERTESILQTAISVSRASDGAFDVTIAPVSRLWNFDDGGHLPEDSMIEKFLGYVDYTLLAVPGDGTAALKKSSMALDLGAIGKGAACDAAIEAYEESDIDRAIVAVGGSVGVYGTKPFNEAWNIAVRDPESDGSLGTLKIYEGFVSTSGSYEKTFTEDGVTYHHLLDPQTGYPADSGLVSVTVKSDSGALSDALSTACFVMGMEDSLAVLEEFDAEAVFITDDKKIYVTSGLDFSLSADGYSVETLE